MMVGTCVRQSGEGIWSRNLNHTSAESVKCSTTKHELARRTLVFFMNNYMCFLFMKPFLYSHGVWSDLSPLQKKALILYQLHVED